MTSVNRPALLGFLLIFVCVTLTSVLCLNDTDTQVLPRRPQKDKPITLHTCCDINLLSSSPVQCKKRAPEDDFNPSKSISIPSHLMAENKTTILKLETKKAPCLPLDMNIVYLNWASPSEAGRSSLFLRNGYLKVENEFYHMDEYCINGKNQTSYEVYVCPQNCRGKRPCVFKCCGLDKLYSFGLPIGQKQKGCLDPVGQPFKPAMYVDFMTKIDPDSILAPHYIEKYPTSFKYMCDNGQNKTVAMVLPNISPIVTNTSEGRVNLLGIPFRLKSDGKILFRTLDGQCNDIDPLVNHICIDGIMNYGETHPYTNNPEELVIVSCGLPQKAGHENIGSYIYGGLMIASSVFLLLTIGVYGLLWERQTVHGWTILSHTISLFFMYIFLGTSHLVRVTFYHEILNTWWCFTLGLLIHFFFLSTFCWLTIISIDLWLTFRAITPRSGRRTKGFSRYLKYSVLGWGLPSIIVGVGWILNAEHPVDSCTESTILTPGYGKENCYLQEKALGVYLYYPIAVMMGIKLTFFAITSVKLYMYRNSTKMATKDDQHQQFFRLFCKLFFVMGVLYIFEVISWGVSGNGLHWNWVIFDVLNILRAVAVFIIFVCKPDIIWALEQNYPCLKPVLMICACIVRDKREFAQRHADSECVGLNSSMSRSTKQSTMRSSSTT